MAKKSTKFVFKGYVNVNLTDPELDQLKLYEDSTDEEVSDRVISVCELGYKIGFSYDAHHGCIALALTCRNEHSMYYGYVFMLTHEEPLRALMAARWLVDTYLIDELYALPDKRRSHNW